MNNCIYTKNWLWNPIVLKLDQSVVWNSKKRGVYWKSKDGWLRIKDGVWFIKKGYKWDGTSAVPDGPNDPEKPGFPISWMASLIHDLGCTYTNKDKTFPYKRSEIDKYFYDILNERKFKYATVYYIGVSIYTQIKKVLPFLRYTKHYS